MNLDTNSSTPVEDSIANNRVPVSFNVKSDERLIDILNTINRLVALDFSGQLKQTEKNDIVDAISLGLKAVGKELQSKVIEKRELEKVNKKLESFSFTAAHDLKSPLNTILGLISVIEQNLANNNNDTLQYLGLLRDTVNKMKSLVIGILDYSRNTRDRVNRKHVDLNILLDELIREDGFDKTSLVLIPNKLPVVFLNRPNAVQVFRNLISNAVKYCGRGIPIINIRFEEEGEFFKFSISDNGIGIPKENQVRIFDLHFKEGEEADSHGIGLYTVKNIIESEGGVIWVESTVGQGSIFYFTLKK